MYLCSFVILCFVCVCWFLFGSCLKNMILRRGPHRLPQVAKGVWAETVESPAIWPVARVPTLSPRPLPALWAVEMWTLKDSALVVLPGSGQCSRLWPQKSVGCFCVCFSCLKRADSLAFLPPQHSTVYTDFRGKAH